LSDNFVREAGRLTSILKLKCDSLNTILENVMELSACRRNNKMEKRKRNRDYARKFKTVSVNLSDEPND
jgi:hypothetical protein